MTTEEHAVKSTVDEAPHTVPCGFGCGYHADREADLNDHETHCANGFPGGDL